MRARGEPTMRCANTSNAGGPSSASSAWSPPKRPRGCRRASSPANPFEEVVPNAHWLCAYPSRMTKVKVCGMTNLDAAEHAAAHGAWAIGLIHHPDSPRYVDPATAEEIGASLKRRCEIAGVFVNSTLDEVV